MMDQQSDTQELLLKIEQLSAGGRGLARLDDGKVVFVAGALAGETVAARIVNDKKDFAEAVCRRVFEPSPRRVQARCPAYGACGGCDLMHLDYAGQLEAKAQWLDRALGRLPGMPPAVAWPSPRQWGWRNRVRFQVRGNRIGFFQRGGHYLEPLRDCPVAHPAISRFLAALAPEVTSGQHRSLAWVEVLANDDDGPFATMGVGAGAKLNNAMKRGLRLAATQAGAKMTRLCRGENLEQWDPGPDNGLLYHSDGQLQLRAYPGLFCQVNLGLNQRLMGLVLEAAGQLPPGEALDLFAGGGNFALPLAQAGWQVCAVEAQPQAAQVMLWQARRAELDERLEILWTQAADAVGRLMSSGRRFDLVVLDPPRAGAKGLMDQVAALAPKRVAYVSCHPAALARDAKELLGYGYAPVALHALDMFPQTSHVEALLILDRP